MPSIYIVFILKSIPELGGMGAYGGEVGGHEVVLAESQEDVGFADT